MQRVEEEAIFLTSTCGVLDIARRTGSRLALFGRTDSQEYVLPREHRRCERRKFDVFCEQVNQGWPKICTFVNKLRKMYTETMWGIGERSFVPHTCKKWMEYKSLNHRQRCSIPNAARRARLCLSWTSESRTFPEGCLHRNNGFAYKLRSGGFRAQMKSFCLS